MILRMDIARVQITRVQIARVQITNVRFVPTLLPIRRVHTSGVA